MIATEVIKKTGSSSINIDTFTVPYKDPYYVLSKLEFDNKKAVNGFTLNKGELGILHNRGNDLNFDITENGYLTVFGDDSDKYFIINEDGPNKGKLAYDISQSSSGIGSMTIETNFIIS